MIINSFDNKSEAKINPKFKKDVLTDYFNLVLNTAKFEKWYCGHYHVDIDFYDYNVFVRFNQIDRIE